MSWLTKFLGYDLTIERLESQIQDYRDLVRSRDEAFYSVLELKDQEIRRLSDLIFKDRGLIVPEGETQHPPNKTFQPINERFSYTRKMRDFEKRDAKLAQELNSEVEKYWQEKAGKDPDQEIKEAKEAVLKQRQS